MEETEPPSTNSTLRRALSYLIGAMVGLAGLAVCGLTLYFCVRLFFEMPTPGQTRLTYVTIAYAMAFVAILGAIACLRLIVPKLRTEGGRLFSPWSIRVLAGMYLAIVILGVVADPQNREIRLLAVTLAVLVALAIRSTLRTRRGPD